MRKPLRAAILLVCMVPLSSLAKDLDIPALGVRLAGLPGTAASPIVVERPDGYQATIAISSTTTLVIDRLDATAPPGAIADESYRKAIFKLLPDDSPAGARGETIPVSGHEAWLTAYVQPSFKMAVYTCRYYVIVDSHAYEFTVTAVAASRPPEFDASITAIPSSVTFEPLRRSTTEPPGWPGLPYMRSSHGFLYYPERARRLGEEGPVDVQFRVTAAGRAQEIKAAGAGGVDLSRAAVKWVASGSFEIPDDWVQRGGPNATLTLEIQFNLARAGGSNCPAPVTPRVPGADVLTVCAPAIPPPN